MVEVIPNYQTLLWEVVVDGVVFGVTKHSYDADFHAEVYCRQHPGTLVEHHANDRAELHEKMEQLRRERKAKAASS